jgi:hypothetical protein
MNSCGLHRVNAINSTVNLAEPYSGRVRPTHDKGHLLSVPTFTTTEYFAEHAETPGLSTYQNQLLVLHVRDCNLLSSPATPSRHEGARIREDGTAGRRSLRFRPTRCAGRVARLESAGRRAESRWGRAWRIYVSESG